MSFLQIRTTQSIIILGLFFAPALCAAIQAEDQFYNDALKSVKTALNGRSVSCFISYAWDGDAGQHKQFAHISAAPAEVILFIESSPR